MNILAYIIYLVATYLITIKVGLICYRNGHHYVLSMLDGNLALTNKMNRLLLVGYYLFNLGYASIIISSWETIGTALELIDSLAFMIGRIVLMLGTMHYFNVFLFSIIHKYHHSKNQSKSIKL